MNKPLDVERIEVHNSYTLYEGEETKLLSFFRPQDWGDPHRWHYHYCVVSFHQGDTEYINHCHVWQQIKRTPIEAFQVIASNLFMVCMPGSDVRACNRSHLKEDDFWCEEWGDMPPYLEEYDDSINE